MNPSGLCMCGCGQPTPLATRNRPEKGLVKGEPRRFLQHHHRRINRSPVDYIEQDCGHETPCWVWQRATTPLGYGRTWVGGENQKAHRVFFERHKGPIPEGLELDHLCRNPACVNPEHLEAVTHAENVRRGKNVKLNYELADEIRDLLRGGATNVALAAQYGVRATTISRVKRNLVWVR